MKNKIFFSAVLAGAIILPVFAVFAYTDTAGVEVPTPGSASWGEYGPGGSLGNYGASGTAVYASTPTGGYASTSTQGYYASTSTGGYASTPTQGYYASTPTGGYAGATPTGEYINRPNNLFDATRTTLGQLLYNLQKYAWIIFAIVAVLLFVLSGALFLEARGDPEKLKTARTALFWAIIGSVIAILAYSIRLIIAYLFK